MKTKKIMIFLSIIVLLFVIAIILIFNTKKELSYASRVEKIYNNIENNKNFTFSMENISKDNKNRIVIAQKDADTSINMYSEDENTTTLIQNGEAYYIMHNNEEYFSIDTEEAEGDLVIAGFEEFKNEPYETGEEEINGKTYYYEEYLKYSSAFTYLIDRQVENEETIKTRFYFDKTDLVYIKNISSEENVEDELLHVKLEYNSDDSLFKIPENYAETSENYE